MSFEEASSEVVSLDAAAGMVLSLAVASDVVPSSPSVAVVAALVSGESPGAPVPMVSGLIAAADELADEGSAAAVSRSAVSSPSEQDVSTAMARRETAVRQSIGFL
jgi:hypothetical protein